DWSSDVCSSDLASARRCPWRPSGLLPGGRLGRGANRPDRLSESWRRITGAAALRARPSGFLLLPDGGVDEPLKPGRERAAILAHVAVVVELRPFRPVPGLGCPAEPPTEALGGKPSKVLQRPRRPALPSAPGSP